MLKRKTHNSDELPEAVKAPTWRPFQLAFLLMNLVGIDRPTSNDREIVDLLFFPTGGGKTEAYLGLAAFTLILRRLRNPGIDGAAMSVLMGYTLRLLTLDPLSRARACLHAKCVVVDEEYILVTSANFTEAAHERTIEAGVMLRDKQQRL